MTNEEAQVLRLNGWEHRAFGHWYKCRICHKDCGYGEVWLSPNYAFYHSSCVMKSAQVKKLLKKHLMLNGG